MAEIRPLEREDLPAVAELLRPNLEGPLELHEGFLASTLLDDPWSDPELPSLVASDESGSIVGFIGAQARRMRLDDRTLRGVCCSHLVVAPASRPGALGARLLQRLMSGPQDLTWSDSMTDVALRMWLVFGGQADLARSRSWMLVLRPGRWLPRVVASLVRHGAAGDELGGVPGLPFEAVRPRRAKRHLSPPPPGVAGEDAAGATIAEHLPSLGARGRLEPAFDSAELQHLASVAEQTLGPLVYRLVRRAGQAVGWYAYIELPGGACRVVHLQALDGEVEASVAELVAHARRSGRSAIGGRLEPNLEEPLRRRFAALGFGGRTVIHARDAGVRALLSSGALLLTQLAGEWFVL